MAGTIDFLCPRCRASIQAPPSASAVICTACRGQFECLFLKGLEGPPPDAQRPAAPAMGRYGSCFSHPANPAERRCRQCFKPLCAVCRFELPLGTYCPDCASAPHGGGAGSTAKAVGSIVLAVAGAATFGGFFVWAGTQGGQVSEKEAEVVGGLLTMVVLGCSVGGIALGFVSKDEARKAGSPLAVVGIVLNVGLLGLLMLLMIAGAALGG